LRDWLAAKRQDLNKRFRLAQRRFSRLSAETVLPLCRELLPPLAGVGEAGSAELLASVYELILLHAGRGTLAPEGGGSPALNELLRVTFPRLRPLLVARPSDLPAALSNAVENLGGRGLEMARGLRDLAAAGEDLLAAGAVLAWRLGEARLRTAALAQARRLAPAVAKLALGIATWPDEAVPRVLDGLEADGWRRPEEILAPTEAAAPARWRLAALLGNFRGFDGHFDQPPLLLDPGDPRPRHRFWVRSGAAQYRVDADVFGWVCRPDPLVDYPVAKKARNVVNGANTSCLSADNLVAFTLADSFRVRVLTPDRGPP
jgi:hypothetical protein